MARRLGSPDPTVVLSLMFPSTGPPRAQDPVRVAPAAFKEKLKNGRVRVLEYISYPGNRESMHSHSDALIYVVKGGKIRSTDPMGNWVELEYNNGEVVWRPAVTHAVENMGKSTIHMIIVEIQETKLG